jgi:hypothetical protein
MAKKARKAKRTKKATKTAKTKSGTSNKKRAARKPAVKKAGRKKAAIKKTALLMAAAPGHPDKRTPISGDPNHEQLCKWSAADNQYICKEVPIGGDWP